MGTAILFGTGFRGGLLLALFFVSGSALTHASRGRSRAVSRRAVQVVANGGVAAAGAVWVAAGSNLGWALMLGSLATSQADTWATEIGQTASRPPRLITTGTVVPRGTSGGVSWKGTIAGTVGALVLSVTGFAIGIPTSTVAWACLGGITGMTADSVLGATVQARFRCSTCSEEVETPVHCGENARTLRGPRWLTNDAVNAVASSLGGLFAVAGSLV